MSEPAKNTEPNGVEVLFMILAFCFLIIPGFAVLAALAVKFTLWLLSIMGLFP